MSTGRTFPNGDEGSGMPHKPKVRVPEVPRHWCSQTRPSPQHPILLLLLFSSSFTSPPTTGTSTIGLGTLIEKHSNLPPKWVPGQKKILIALGN
ncbi:unnamed protein product [Clonostachys chloroleuca]|uniref:Uncharacterized protein n=1 Tax=Clonostachys chloroleuca TaxID=1926264 RepID=A0AA35QAZ8_9HYPO|nr:unnamed protein product [Clonostachys chloroleuca]